MAKTVTFPYTTDDTTTGVMWQLAPSVYVREHWADAWTQVENLYPLEVTWSVAPTLPVAVLEMDYGYIRQSYRTADDAGNETFGFAEVLKTVATDLVGQFVKIQCETVSSENTLDDGSHETARYWYGVIEEAHDEQHGVDLATGRCYGKITLVAYGLEKLLSDHQILTSICHGLVEIGVPLDFNRAGPNGVEGNQHHDDFAGVYLFGDDPTTVQKWSSRRIANYLLAYQTPVDQANAPKLTWALHADAVAMVTDVDSPLLKADNSTTYSLLCQLLDRRRGLVWWVEPDDDDADSTLWIKVDTITANAVAGNKFTLPANGNQANVSYDADPLTSVVVNSSELPRYDQVVARGPRIRCVGTFSAEDGTLDEGWDNDEEELYWEDGNPHPDGTALKTKQERNDAARRAPKLANVYSLFKVPDDWDFQVGDGEGTPAYPMFVDSDGEPQDQNYLALSFEQTLPILEGEDYEGTRIRAGQVPLPLVNEQEMRPLCFFRQPSRTAPPYKYQPVEGIDASLECTDPDDDKRLQCHLSVPPNTLTVRLNVSGQPQHAIAYADFVPITGEDKPCGKMDWKKAVFTLSIESLFHTEGRWPDPPLTSDFVRKKIIYAGDQYYQHYVAEGTVVGIDKDGYLIRSDGGWIPTLGAPEDPLPLLEDIARIAAAWYTASHYVLTIESYRLKPRVDLSLGMLILTAGGGVTGQTGHEMTVNAPITQIKFTYQRGSGDKCPPARMQVKTWAGELDAVEFVKPRPLEVKAWVKEHFPPQR